MLEQATLSETVIGARATIPVRILRILLVTAIAGFFFVGIPVLNRQGVIPDYRIQLLGKYLCFAIAAIGADLIWGYTGMLSLCQALFFCLGGYAVGMYLSLPQGGGIYDVPQFLSFAYYGANDPMPLFWKPFKWLPVAVILGFLVTAVLSTTFGFFIFRSRVRGVYFSIVTQAVAWGAWLMMCQNAMLMGGTNGLTNFSKSFSQERSWIVGLYLLTCGCLVIAYLVCRWITQSRAGRVMVAIRDKEMRLYFAGYKPYAFKVFAFTVGSLVAALGGMLYPAQVQIITPQDMNVQASIDLVVLVAVGGRGKLWGAILGALLVTTLRSSFTSDLPSFYYLLYGLTFILVVLFLPDGIAGLWSSIETAISTGHEIVEAFSSLIIFSAVGAFILGEDLDLMPPLMQSEPVILLPLGKMCLVALLVLSLYGWLAVATLKSDLAKVGRTVLLSAGGAVALTALIFCIIKLREPIAFQMKFKFPILIGAIVFAVAIRLIARQFRRPAAVVPDADASELAEDEGESESPRVSVA